MINHKLFYLFTLLFVFAFGGFSISNADNNDETKNVSVKNEKRVAKIDKDNILDKKTSFEKKNKTIRKAKRNNKKNVRTDMPEDGSVVLSNKMVNVKSPLCQLAMKNDVLALKRILSKNNYKEQEVNTICKNEESLLFIAVKYDNYLTAKFLIEKGADVNLQNEAGVSPLHLLARINKKDTEKIINLFMEIRSLDKNAKDINGYTPLMRAVEFEKVDFVRQLVENGADIGVKNNYKLDALELAEKVLEGKKEDEDKNNIEKIIKILNS